MSVGKAVARRAAFHLATSDRLERVVLAVPPLRTLAYRRATRYVAGRDAESALATVQALAGRGLSASIDLFGENVTSDADAERVTSRYVELARVVHGQPGTYVSLDCSHLGLDRDPDACRDRVRRIAGALPDGSRLQLGAEESWRTDAALALAHAVASDGLPIMVTVQANLRRSAADIEELAGAGIPVRLVKGAYVEPDRVAYRWGAETDDSYIRLARRLEQLGLDHSLATHDPGLLGPLVRDRERTAIEFLLGVRGEDAERLAKEGQSVRVYVPYGQRWFRYYARRAAESIGG